MIIKKGKEKKNPRICQHLRQPLKHLTLKSAYLRERITFVLSFQEEPYFTITKWPYLMGESSTSQKNDS